jgi:tRNA uridine 5-carbamoylmethylation protein Kti12
MGSSNTEDANNNIMITTLPIARVDMTKEGIKGIIRTIMEFDTTMIVVEATIASNIRIPDIKMKITTITTEKKRLMIMFIKKFNKIMTINIER